MAAERRGHKNVVSVRPLVVLFGLSEAERAAACLFLSAAITQFSNR